MLTNGDRCFNYVRAFPSIESQEIGKGSRESSQLFNVVDIYLGQDGTLWALDVGIYETLSDHPIRENDPKVVGFDISTGKVKYVISLRSLSCLSRSRLQYIVVEYLKESTTVLYIGDGGTRSIIVWYVESNEGYRIKLPHIVIQGCSELPHEDVFYIALIELCTGNYLYFSYLSSSDLYRVRTKDLRRQMNPRCIVNIGKKPCKMVFLGVGYETVLYFRIRGQNHLYSWDSRLSFLEENFMVVRKSKDCRAITHVDVDNVGTLWVLESNIQDYLMGHVGCYGPNMMLGPVLGDPIPVWSNCNEEEKC
ncbi:uncharacterized protein LOC126898822 [Daktulosphaira vitifoliae]|uniref:uncharacterized protein LOC126898822 n=1 Tax=Daktulosphaira vitifoliae TaxID=58002 RepID=UPI0021AA1C1C|nr:uncharacterized protein LOC126898822 [Daktulosphaira vitifoliae]